MAGLAKVSAQNRADDMLVNAINGGEVDCVIAALSAPLQEDFVIRNRNLLDVRAFLGIGKSTLPVCRNSFVSGKLGQFLVNTFLKRDREEKTKIKRKLTKICDFPFILVKYIKINRVVYIFTTSFQLCCENVY